MRRSDTSMIHFLTTLKSIQRPSRAVNKSKSSMQEMSSWSEVLSDDPMWFYCWSGDVPSEHLQSSPVLRTLYSEILRKSFNNSKNTVTIFEHISKMFFVQFFPLLLQCLAKPWLTDKTSVYSKLTHPKIYSLLCYTWSKHSVIIAVLQ